MLLRRIRDEYQRFDVVIERPLRSPRDRFLNRPEEMSRMLAFAAGRAGPDGCILVLLDADDDCVAELVARYHADVTRLAGATDCGLVFAKSEFESWFIAGVESLHGFHRIPDGLSAPVNPEDVRRQSPIPAPISAHRVVPDSRDSALVADYAILVGW